MLMKTVKVSEKGQVAIPVDIRKSAGIKRGDEIVLIQDKGKILIEKSGQATKKFEDDFKDILKYSKKALEKVWNNKEDGN